MAKEIELKLSVSRHHIESLKQQPLFQSGFVSEQGAKSLKNIYFDTPGHDLSKHRIALRIREKEGRFIQTLKTQGLSEAGLHQRNEWEWFVDEPELDFALLQKAPWPDVLNTPEMREKIEPVFATDFVRHIWLYESVDAQGQRLQVEIALDQGQAWIDLHGERRHDDICELELELVEGDPAMLFQVALQLGQQIPLLSSDISKAQRGYRLHQPEAFRVTVPDLNIGAEDNLEETFCKLLQRELALWPQYLEAWRFTRDWQYVTLALESLRNIGGLYESFADIIPANPDGDLDALLTKLIRQLRDVDAWHRTALLMGDQGLAWQQAAKKRAEARMEVLLQTVGFGQIALRISLQLVSRLWRNRWTDEHQQRAQALLAEN
ncbi:MAG: inorganic triphosphatase [Pontibacterium sp.]